MTKKQALFAEEFLKDMNATRAAIRAGYAENSAHVTGHRLGNAKHIKAAVDARLEEARTKVKMSAEEVLERMTVLARANVGDYISWTGGSVTVTPSSELTQSQLYGIRRVVLYQEVRDTKGHVVRLASVKEIEIADPRRAVEYMGRLNSLDRQGQSVAKRADVVVEGTEPAVILILPDNGRGDAPPPLPPLSPKVPS